MRRLSTGIAALLAAAVPCACEDAGPAAAPAVPCEIGPGGLLVTEVMARPAPADPRIEWFEVHNPTASRVRLAGVVLEAGSRSNPRRHRVPPFLDPGLEPGASLAVGNGFLDDGVTGYAWPGMALADDGGTITLRCGDQVVDQVAWGDDAGSAPGKALAGVSWQRSPRTFPVPGDAEPPAAWCPAAEGAIYDAAGDRGTPGLPNGDCPQAGECREGEAWRRVATPGAGDLVITEVFANPAGTDSPRREWIEVRAGRDGDLNGLVLANRQDGHARLHVIDAPACLRVRAGDFAVLAGSDDPSANGALPRAAWAFPSGLSLYNGDATLALETADGVPVASAAPPASVEGASRSLRPDRLEDPGAASVGANWCTATASGRFDGLGTPGAPNDPCP